MLKERRMFNYHSKFNVLCKTFKTLFSLVLYLEFFEKNHHSTDIVEKPIRIDVVIEYYSTNSYERDSTPKIKKDLTRKHTTNKL